MHSNKNSPSETDLTFKLAHITFNHGAFLAFTWVLSNWKIEQSSQALCLKLFAQPLFWSFASFQNKTQSYYCMTLLDFSIYVVFVDPHQGINDVMPFSSTTKTYVELIEVEKT
jgi:hypothetical protein